MSAGADFNNPLLAKKTAAVDTLEVSLAGFGTEKKPLDSYIGNYYIVLKKGSAGQIFFDKLNYLSATKATITVVDSDLDANVPYLQIAVSSTSDPAWIFLILSPVSGKLGTFSGVLNFSTKTSSQNTILVNDGDTVSAVYSDANPLAYPKAKATWNGMAGKVSVDSVSYTGMASRMTITLEDSDITDSVASVKVTSTIDTTGIITALKAVAGIAGRFTGSVGFSIMNSGSGIIHVAESSVVMVSYNDAAPKGIRATTAKFYLGWKKGLGIYGSNVMPAGMVKAGVLPKFYIWGPNSCMEDTARNFAGTGTTKKLIAGGTGWAGFGWFQVTDTSLLILSSINMTEFAACSLHVMLKGNATGINLLVENQTHAGQTWVPAANYGYVGDEQWHEVVVPLSAWAATCDLSGVSYFCGVVFSPYTAGQYIVIDNLYWTLP